MGLLPHSFSMIILVFLVHVTTAADFTNLVFKGCADQKFQEPSDIYSQNLKTLYSSLISQSTQKSFATTTTGDDQTAIMGLYQCRGDLTITDCSTCVTKIPEMASKLCGHKAIAARIQLSGCYLRYEVIGFKQVSETQLLYKICGGGGGSKSNPGFEEKRDTAFNMVRNGVKNNGLFYAGNYQQVYVLGQCEGDLSSNDCEDCVKSAQEKSKSECGGSISGQVYLHKCYISFSYYPNGVPSSTSSPSSSSDVAVVTKQHTQRVVAIAIGGVVALGFGVVVLMFLKSAMKKKRVEYN